MDISQVNAGALRGLLKLLDKRDALLKKLKAVDAALAKAYSGSGGRAVPAPRRTKGKAAPAGGKKGRKRGALKAKIVAALKAAGDKGVAIKDLSKSLGVKNQNIHVWFATTGKKLGIQRVAAGRYRLKP